MRRLAALAIVSALCDSVGLIAGARGELSELFASPSVWLVVSVILWVALCIMALRIGMPALKRIWHEEGERLRCLRERRRNR